MRKTIRTSRIGFVVFVLACLGTPLSAQMDPTGRWLNRMHGDSPEPEIGDYTSLPLNEGGRAKAESWKASAQTLPERQCIPHGWAYTGTPFPLRITADHDPITDAVVDYQVTGTFGHAKHVVYMDGRPHPPEEALHTFGGFTTGQWEGNTLTTYTDHLKMNYLRRNGVPTSDQTTVIDHFTRHADQLERVVFVVDPVYLTEPYIQSGTYVLDPTMQVVQIDSRPCEVIVEEDRPEGVVPHWLPGANTQLYDFSKLYGLGEAVRGGAETMYPEYREKLKDLYKRPEKCTRYCQFGVGGTG